MTNLYLDIETLPTDSNQEIDYVVANIKAPGNYKNPEAIAAYIDKARDESVSKTSLSGLFGRVYMIGYALDRGPVSVLRGDTEQEVISQFNRMMIDSGLRTEYGDKDVNIIGHNAKGFDVPFLSQRMMVNGFKPIYQPRKSGLSATVYDTMEMFACGKYKEYYSLEALMMAFGLTCSKSGMDGSQVHDYYLAGRHDEVAEYCAGDVEDVRALYLQMTDHKAAA